MECKNRTFLTLRITLTTCHLIFENYSRTVVIQIREPVLWFIESRGYGSKNRRFLCHLIFVKFFKFRNHDGIHKEIRYFWGFFFLFFFSHSRGQGSKYYHDNRRGSTPLSENCPALDNHLPARKSQRFGYFRNLKTGGSLERTRVYGRLEG